MAKVILSDSFESVLLQFNTEIRTKWPGGRVSTLSTFELKKFTSHNYIRGWLLVDESNDISYKVLVTESFPYDVPRIAIQKYSDPDHSFELELPHVEECNLLCLPFVDSDSENPIEVILKQLKAAEYFYNQYSNDVQKIQDDFQAEFVSYWTRASKKSRKTILSLLEPRGNSRKIICTLTDEGKFLVAENTEQAKDWLKNLYPNNQRSVRTINGYFFSLDDAPVPQFPSDLAELDTFISQHAPESLELYRDSLKKSQQQIYVFAAKGRGSRDGLLGTGVVCVLIQPNGNKVNLLKGGFRSVDAVPPDILRNRINNSIDFERRNTARVDHSWIHSRGDESKTDLSKTKIMLIGCGSLGSHVAVRLAQMGIGSLYIVDPQLLESANVSRHALGVFALNKPKAETLAFDLRLRFPHLNIQFENEMWKKLSEDGQDFMKGSTLILSTMAEWSGEGSLNEYWIGDGNLPPVLYGWIEARATAAHAVLIQDKGTCLNCVRNKNGVMYVSETIGWPDIGGIQTEPACGTLYQPYGALDLAQGEILVANTVSDFLSEKLESNHHFVQTVSTDRLTELGGKWSPHHLTQRPDGYSGILNYERNLAPNPNCSFHKI